LNQHSFEGNIRELRNIVERSYYLCEGNMITEKYFMERNHRNETRLDQSSVKKILPMETVEEQCIRDALEYCSGNVMKVSELLKIGKATVYRKIDRYGIDLSLYHSE
jgi:DNA-binding NtrC family response regulator